MKSKQKKRHILKRRSGALVIALVVGVGIAVLASTVVWQSGPTIAREEADIVVYKRTSCSCCNEWVSHLRDSGLLVSVQNVGDTRSIQSSLGVPDELQACHTAQVGDYWVEGHVPADLIYGLLNDKPQDVRRIAVAGMPVGSPGMGGANATTYDVMRVKPDGESWATPPAGTMSSRTWTWICISWA